MRKLSLALLLALIAAGVRADQPVSRVVTTGVLLEEMKDLAALARLPSPAYRNVQFSSYDRRSTTPEAPGWFSNADGFGDEPIPGFLKTLREPPAARRAVPAGRSPRARRDRPRLVGGNGRHSARLSRSEDGRRRRNRRHVDLRRARLRLSRAAFGLTSRNRRRSKSMRRTLSSRKTPIILPIPFARGLRVTWEGSFNELHFYHLQVREYAAGTRSAASMRKRT